MGMSKYAWISRGTHVGTGIGYFTRSFSGLIRRPSRSGKQRLVACLEPSVLWTPEWHGTARHVTMSGEWGSLPALPFPMRSRNGVIIIIIRHMPALVCGAFQVGGPKYV